MKKSFRGYAVYLLLFFLAVISPLQAGCSTGSNDEVIASGIVEATEVNVSAEIAGRITEVAAGEGDTVKQGDTLVRLDSTVQALNVQQAEAALRAAREKARETKSGTREQLIAQAREAVTQMASLQRGALKTMENARENLDRVNSLFAEGGATSQQVSDAQTKYESARAQYEAYTSQKKSALEQLDLLLSGATKEAVNIADAGVAQAQAAVSIARAQLAKTTIHSPINGSVSTVNFDKGEYIAPGAPLMTLTDLNDLWINVYIAEKDLPLIRVGQKAEIFVDAYPDKPFNGEVSFISDKAEFTPKNLQTKEERVNMVFAVKIKIKDGKERLKPGLPADVKILTGRN